MSLAYHRTKMRLTTLSVNHARSFCDGCNVVLHTVAYPFRRIGQRISAEAPWVTALFACTFVTIIPLVLYPYIKPWVFEDKRAKMEAERVRLCLQKGMDPYPYMRHKDYVYGNNVALTVLDGETPATVGWEHESIVEFQRRKEELRKEVGGNIEDTVDKLLRLKKQQRAEYESQRGKMPVEPRNLVFYGRKDVDVLKS